MELSGSHVAIVTPFREGRGSGEVNYDLLRKASRR